MDQLKQNAQETIHNFLNTWIRRVVGSVFGGMPNYWDRTSTRLDRETKVHDVCMLLALFEMCTSADHVQLWQDFLELRCPPPV